MEQKFQKWTKWLDEIYKQLQNVLIQRHIFWEVQEIIRSNPKIQKPSAFYDFLGNAYASLGLTAVRRLVKAQRDSISLSGLLIEIRDNPEILNSSRYAALFTGSIGPVQGEFEGICGEIVDDHINPEIVQGELDKLAEKAAILEDFVDKTIAHLDKRSLTGNVTSPTFNELDECLDFIEELVKKYWLLFTAQAVDSMTPTFQYNWQEIFSEPWIDQN